MTIKDPFSYSSRWDSIGLDCSNCNHFHGPENWPDLIRESRCNLHQISLSIELDKSGFKKWEWFCKDFENKDAFPRAIEEFLSIQDELKPRVLYRGYNRKTGKLLEFKFEKLHEST